MVEINREDIRKMDKIYRLNLINCVPGYKSANLIGTKSKNGQSNLAIFNSVIHIGSNPPLLGFLLRPANVPRHTYQNIEETKLFTVNHIHAEFIDKAHYTSAKFNQNISEFTMAGLTEEYLNDFYPPFVKESKLKIALSFLEEYEIKANKTILIVGEIQSIFLPEDIVEKNGVLNLNKINDVCISGLNNYHKAEQIVSFDYARPGKFPAGNR